VRLVMKHLGSDIIALRAPMGKAAVAQPMQNAGDHLGGVAAMARRRLWWRSADRRRHDRRADDRVRPETVVQAGPHRRPNRAPAPKCAPWKPQRRLAGMLAPAS
jgi:hypothetical protein